MRQIFLLILWVGLMAIALVTGAFVLLVLAGVIALAALYLFIRRKITGEPPFAFRVYTFEQRARPPEDAPPQVRVIEAEYEEIDEKRG